MSDTNKVNPQTVDSINKGQQAVMIPEVIQASVAGKAYHSVAQSAAISVQDASDYLRNASLISTTAAGAALAQLLAGSGNSDNATKALTEANKLVSEAATNFKTISDNVASLMDKFPPSR